VIDGLQRVRPGSPVTPSVVDMAPADASAAPVTAAPVAPSKDAPAATAETPAANAAPASADAPSATAEAPKAAAATPEPTAEAPKAPVQAPKPAVAASPAPSAPKPAASTKAADAKVTDAAPAATQTSYSADWLREQAPDSYALQLLGATDRKATERFLKRHALADKAAVLETRRADKPWFIVVTGHYPDAAQAQAAVAELSPELRKAVQAWPRSVKALAALTR
jgi:septal ring-binding cell division protein DamX